MSRDYTTRAVWRGFRTRDGQRYAQLIVSNRSYTYPVDPAVYARFSVGQTVTVTISDGVVTGVQA